MTDETLTGAADVAAGDESTKEEGDALDQALAAALESTEAAPTEEAAPAEENSEPATEEAGEDTEGEGQQTEASPAEELPQHWTEEMRAEYLAIQDPSARDVVRKIEKNLWSAHTKRSQELAEDSRLAQSVKEALTPLSADMRAAGLNEQATMRYIVDQYATVVNGLRTNPKETLQALAANYGVTFDGSESSDDVYYTDAEKALMARQQQTEFQLQQLLRQQQAAHITPYQRQVEEFASMKDEKGELKHPHFARLYDSMTALIEKKVATSLDDAYEKAARLDPELYPQTLESEIKKRQLQQQRNADLEKARKAKRVLSGSAPARPMTQVRSVDDALQLAVKQTMSA